MTNPEHDLLCQIVSQYDLGQLAGFQRLTLGYVNTSYIIEMARDGEDRKYLLRLYKRGIQEEELRFEHSIINHLVARNFELSAAILPDRTGATYIRVTPEGRPAFEGIYCAIFEFLPGEDRFTWVRPECSRDELTASAGALARFHDAVMGLVPDGRRVEPKIIELLPEMSGAITRRLARLGDNVFEETLVKSRDEILEAIERVRRAIDPGKLAGTPHLVIHGDYHPGNLKFEGSQVVGLFDLDWSKIDARTFDLGLALTYFCASWDQDDQDTYFRLDRAETFLRAYQATAQELPDLPALDEVEIALLPAMCAAGNIYVMEWAQRDFYSRPANPQEYLGYLNHHLRLLRWYEDKGNQERLKKLVAACAGEVNRAGE